MVPQVIEEINTKLDSIRETERVAIPLAVESGSRAWGFPSPDSDYDCRFIYIRPWRDAVALFPIRDVIEVPLTPVLDINGWDLAKALKLALKGNAVVLEWLNSPIHYRMDNSFRQVLLEFTSSVFNMSLLAWHYSRLLLRDFDRAAEREAFTSKRFFYILRPALALRFLSENPEARNLPMNIQQICEGIGLSPAIREAIDSAVQEKASLREKQKFVVRHEVVEFVIREAERARTILPPQRLPRPDLEKHAQAIYTTLVEEFDESL